jgi:hypothetical protein
MVLFEPIQVYLWSSLIWPEQEYVFPLQYKKLLMGYQHDRARPYIYHFYEILYIPFIYQLKYFDFCVWVYIFTYAIILLLMFFLSLIIKNAHITCMECWFINLLTLWMTLSWSISLIKRLFSLLYNLYKRNWYEVLIIFS